MPIQTQRVGVSRRNRGESNATHSGPVLTSATEAMTVVYSSEVIQVAKWTERKSPASAARNHSRRVRARISSRWRSRANGARARLARVSRAAAMTSEGASSCAWRMKMEAVETARMAIKMARETRDLGMLV